MFFLVLSYGISTALPQIFISLQFLNHPSKGVHRCFRKRLFEFSEASVQWCFEKITAYKISTTPVKREFLGISKKATFQNITVYMSEFSTELQNVEISSVTLLKRSLLNYVPHVLSYLTCLVSALMPDVPRALHALVPHVSRVLRAIVRYDPRVHTCSRASRASCPTCSCALRASCPTCSRASRASCLTCLLPYVPRAKRALVFHVS